MRFQENKSKNGYKCYFIVKSVYDNGKRTNKVIEKLGSYEELVARAGDEDPIEWGHNYAKQLTEEEKIQKEEILIPFKPSLTINKDENKLFNGGYLFLQQIYYELGLDKISKNISKKYKFQYDLNDILSKLVYSRILSPSSKKSSYEYSQKFLEQPKFDLHHIYRSLEILSKESDYIQSEVYKNSNKKYSRDTDIIYYDCTNFFFEIEECEDDKQYGVSKEGRPNPIVQMGLFMDSDGIPLAMNITPGNMNEQRTMKPLEKKLIKDFEIRHMVVCTDAGLSSRENRTFNVIQGRDFITTQSIKKMNSNLKSWCLSLDGWRLSGKTNEYNLGKILSDDVLKKTYKDKIFYKEQWEIDDKGFEQRYIVSFSIKYMEYLKSIRNNHIQRALNSISKNSSDKKRQTDFRRLIKRISVTKEGEVASSDSYTIDTNMIDEESKYDGFYCVCTSLENPVEQILRINKHRWEIEENFRILKSDFEARPVYVKREDRIKAHFLTCFLALTVFRILEKKKLFEEYTSNNILKELREMNFYQIFGEGYVPTYTRTDFTDAIHETFGFRTDYTIIKKQTMKQIIKNTKKA